MEYKEKLKDERWKRRRRQVLIRDNFCCQSCNHRALNNEVHHVVYLFDRDPWDYDDLYLITLCRLCHQRETDDWLRLKYTINEMKLSGMLCYEIMVKMNIKFD